MKRIIIILLVLFSVVVEAQYNPTNFTISNKSYGVSQAVSTDARSWYYDTGTFTMRNYQNRAEVLTYLNLAKYRSGRFPIFMDTAGVTMEFWFRNGTADFNLVLKYPQTVTTDSTIFATNYRVDTAKVNLRNDINGKLSSTLASGRILVGNVSNVAAAVIPSNDVSMTSGGSFTVNNQWKLTGNLTTTDVTNFVGTRDNVPLSFKVNNFLSGRIDNTNANTFFGYRSGGLISSANNSAFGYGALLGNSSGGGNTAIGTQSMFSSTFGNNNTSVGYNALSNNTTGGSNTVLGYNTGLGITTGNYNTIIGANVTGLSASLSNNIIIADGQGNKMLTIDAAGTSVLSSTTALGLPVGNTAQRPSSPATGYLRYNTDSAAKETYNGSAWVKDGSGGGGGSGITTLNTLTAATQTFATGTTGTDFGIVSSVSTHTFNLPVSSASNTGKLSSTDWSTFNNKVSATRAINTGFGLSGGGNLSADRTLVFDSAAGGTGSGFHTQGYDDVRYLSKTLTSAHLFVGNGSNIATDVALSGDATLSNTGALTIANDAITTIKILNNAVTYGKMQAMTANRLLGSGASGTAVTEITLGTNLSFTGTTLNATGGGGSVTVRDSLSYINVGKFGMGSGTTDNGARFAVLLGLGYRSFYFPADTYPWLTMVQLPDSVKIFGDGKRSIIKLTTNITALKGGYAAGGMKCEFDGISFVGTRGSGGINTTQEGIVLDSINGCLINNVSSYLMGGTFLRIKNSAYVPTGNNFVLGNIVTNCFGQANEIGLYIDERAEFTRVANSTFADGPYGIRIKAGNAFVIGNNCSGDAYGFYIETGSNDGHGVLTGNVAAHCGTAGLYATGVLNGMEFDGNDFNASDVTFINCVDMTVMGGQISTNRTITITNCTRTLFKDIIYLGGAAGGPTWTYTGQVPSIVTSLNSINTNSIYDAQSGSFFNIRNNNGMFEFSGAGGGGSFFQFTGLPIYTAFSNHDATRDLCVGTARFDYGGTATTDAYQFFISAGTANSLSVLNYHLAAVSGYYALLVDNAGNTGILKDAGTIGAHLDVGGGTTAIPAFRIGAGTPTTTFVPGSFQFNAGLYIIDSSTSHRDTIATRDWVRDNFSSGGGGTTYTIGAINSQTKSANGLVISGSSLVAQTADATHLGMMTADQWNTVDSVQKNLYALDTIYSFHYTGSGGVQPGDLRNDTIFWKNFTGPLSVALSNNTDSTIKVQLVNDSSLGSASRYYYGSNTAGRLGYYALPTALTTVAFGSTPNSNGGSISGATLALQPADASNPGGVSTVSQTFSGAKTFGQLIATGGTSLGTSHLVISGNLTGSAQGPGANGIHIAAYTYTDNSSATGNNATNQPANIIIAPTYAATNSGVVYTGDVSTLSITGPPIAGSNVTINNPYALKINSGNTLLGGDLTVTGNVNLSSLNGYPHTIFTPTTGGTVNTVVKQYNIINPAGALLALTVNLPSTPSNNDIVYIKFTQAVTTVTYANGTVQDGIASPIAGGLVMLVYDSGTTTWY